MEIQDKQHPRPIVIIEDSEADAVLLQRALKRSGLTQVITLKDMSEAKAYLGGRGAFSDRVKYPVPSVMFVDLCLPDGDPMEELPAWRTLLGKHTLMVIVTGSSRVPNLQDVYNRGADSFLTKPVQESELEHLVIFYESFFKGAKAPDLKTNFNQVPDSATAHPGADAFQ